MDTQKPAKKSAPAQADQQNATTGSSTEKSGALPPPPPPPPETPKRRESVNTRADGQGGGKKTGQPAPPPPPPPADKSKGKEKKEQGGQRGSGTPPPEKQGSPPPPPRPSKASGEGSGHKKTTAEQDTAEKDKDKGGEEGRGKKPTHGGFFSGLRNRLSGEHDEDDDEQPTGSGTGSGAGGGAPKSGERKAETHGHHKPSTSSNEAPKDVREGHRTHHQTRPSETTHNMDTNADTDAGFGLHDSKQTYAENYREASCKDCGKFILIDKSTGKLADPQPAIICTHCGQNWPEHTNFPPAPKADERCTECTAKFEKDKEDEQRARDVNEMAKNAPKEAWPDNARRKALIIACNYYGQGDIELQGPKDDAYAMRDLLEGRGYKVVLLLDQLDYPPAMRHTILQYMRKLIESAKKGDRLFIHFSGHGGQTKSKDPDEPDGEDEGIYPADFRRYKAGEKMITDNEMHETLTQAPFGSALTCVIDSCHSGSALDLQYIQKSPDDVKLRSATTRHERPARNGGSVLLISGCMDSQSSMDTVVRGKHVGAMSSAFIRAMQETGLDKENKEIPLYDLLGIIRTKIKNHENEHFKTQTPVISSNEKLDLHRAKFKL